MARILVTGSTDGLGRAAADALLAGGHDIVVHARSHERAAALSPLLERGAVLVVANLSRRQEVLDAAVELNAGGQLHAVIHNAGVLDGPALLPVNVVAPYLLTALLRTPTRHVYLSSSMHRGGRADLEGLDWDGTRMTAGYGDSKLLVTVLSAAVAGLWSPRILADAVDPGWVATKMGGAGAPDDFALGHRTQEDLATNPDRADTGGYWYHGARQRPHPAVADAVVRRSLLAVLPRDVGRVIAAW